MRLCKILLYTFLIIIIEAIIIIIFKEFEGFDEESETVLLNEEPEKEKPSKEAFEESDDAFVSDEEQEETEGFDIKEEKPVADTRITIAKVPLNLGQNFYYFVLFGLLVCFMNFALGKNKNTKIAKTWFQTHRQILEDTFPMYGDDGNLITSEHFNLIKKSENVFTLWCNGRTCCEGMLVELRLIKRQDLLAVLSGMMRPTLDQVHVTVRMNKEYMDSFIFLVANKKTSLRLVKDLTDLSVYCPERKAGEEYGIPSSFNVMSEISEATSAMLDSKVTAVLNKYADYVDYIHFSDQYSGPKPTDTDTQKVLRFGFNIPVKGVPLKEAMTRLKPLMNMVFYCIDKVKRYHLPKEAKPLRAQASQDRTLQLVISREGQPKSGFSEAQLLQFLDAVRMALSQTQSGSAASPQFNSTKLWRRQLLVTAANEESRNWLLRELPNISPWEDTQLVAVDLATFKLQRAMVFFPGKKPLSNQDIIGALERQNPGLSCDQWRVRERTEGPRGLTLIVGIDEQSIATLRRVDFQPFYSATRVRFNLIDQVEW